jgi:hypothetical protein
MRACSRLSACTCTKACLCNMWIVCWLLSRRWLFSRDASPRTFWLWFCSIERLSTCPRPHARSFHSGLVGGARSKETGRVTERALLPRVCLGSQLGRPTTAAAPLCRPERGGCRRAARRADIDPERFYNCLLHFSSPCAQRTAPAQATHDVRAYTAAAAELGVILLCLLLSE